MRSRCFAASAGIDSDGELIVVTEDNEVFALDAQSGKQIWRRALGSPCSALRAPLRQYFTARSYRRARDR